MAAKGLPIVLGVSLLVWVVSRFPFGDISETCRRLGPALLLSPLLALGWHACNTSAFRVLLEEKVPWSVLYWNRLVGDGYNNLLPLAGLGGEPFRLRHLSTYMPAQQAVAALIRDRVIESGFGLVFTAACLVVSVPSVDLPRPLKTAIWIFALVAILIASLAFTLARSRYPGRAGQLLGRWLGSDASEALAGLPWRRLLRVVAWHVPARVLGLVEVAVVFSLLGLPLDPARILLTDNLLNASGFLGFAFPQGLGVMEGTAVYLFGLLGYAGPYAIAFAFARRGRLLLVSLLGIALHVPALLRARGRPRSPQAWDAEYHRGAWQYLDGIHEMGHYAIIAGYVERLASKPRVLDVGCGHGRLYQLLRAHPLESYLGLDLSEAAIEKAHAIAADGARFAVGNFETEAPIGPFDVVIFNESIYYAASPPGVFSRYLSALSERGLAVVSIRDMLKNRHIRRSLHRVRRPLHTTAITNDRGERWHVDVFAK